MKDIIEVLSHPQLFLAATFLVAQVLFSLLYLIEKDAVVARRYFALSLIAFTFFAVGLGANSTRDRWYDALLAREKLESVAFAICSLALLSPLARVLRSRVSGLAMPSVQFMTRYFYAAVVYVFAVSSGAGPHAGLSVPGLLELGLLVFFSLLIYLILCRPTHGASLRSFGLGMDSELSRRSLK